MSSPIAESSVNSSQTANILDGNNEMGVSSMTPTTVTPVPEIEMEDANAPQDDSNNPKSMDDHDIIGEAAEEDEEIEEEEEEESLSLPLSKIKRIFKMDPDYLAASQSAVYATGLATELFIQYFTEQALVLAKMDKRKKIQYKDFSNAVASHDSLHFLSDTVPKTQPVGELINNKKINVNNQDTAEAMDNGNTEAEEIQIDGQGSEVKSVKPLPKGQQTLNFATMDKTPAAAPIKKSIISDIVTTDNDTETTSKEATEEAEDDDVVMTN